MPDRQGGKLLAVTIEEWITGDHQRAAAQLAQGCEDRIQVRTCAAVHDLKIESQRAGRRVIVSQEGLSLEIGRVDERVNTRRAGQQLARHL